MWAGLVSAEGHRRFFGNLHIYIHSWVWNQHQNQRSRPAFNQHNTKKNQMVTGFWRRRRKDGDAAVMTFQWSVWKSQVIRLSDTSVMYHHHHRYCALSRVCMLKIDILNVTESKASCHDSCQYTDGYELNADTHWAQCEGDSYRPLLLSLLLFQVGGTVV